MFREHDAVTKMNPELKTAKDFRMKKTYCHGAEHVFRN
jgi:hypothetical protein